MQQERPHRPALSAEAAAAELREEVTAGRLDRRAADAVLDAAHAAGRRRREHPAGISDREVEILGLICLGLTNRQRGQRLHITEKLLATMSNTSTTRSAEPPAPGPRCSRGARAGGYCASPTSMRSHFLEQPLTDIEASPNLLATSWIRGQHAREEERCDPQSHHRR